MCILIAIAPGERFQSAKLHFRARREPKGRRYDTRPIRSRRRRPRGLYSRLFALVSASGRVPMSRRRDDSVYFPGGTGGNCATARRGGINGLVRDPTRTTQRARGSVFAE